MTVKITLPDGRVEWREVSRFAISMLITQLRLPIRPDQIGGIKLEIPVGSDATREVAR